MISKTKLQSLGFNAICAGLATSLMLFQAPITTLADPTSEMQAAQDKIDAIAQELAASQKQFDENEAQLQQTAYSISQTETNIQNTKAKLDGAKGVLSKRVRSAYKSGATSLLELIMGSVDMQDLVSRIHYLDSISQEDARSINEVKELSGALARQHQELQEKQSQEQAQAQELQSKIDSVQAKLQDAKVYFDSLSEQARQELTQEAQSDTSSARAAVVQTLSEMPAQPSQAQVAPEAPSEAQPAPEAPAPQTPAEKPQETPKKPAPQKSFNDAGGPVANAYQLLNKGFRYVWASNNPSNGGFDCSGFIQYIYRLSGRSISRTTWTQSDQIKARGGWKTSIDQLEVGDLVFFNNLNHVGIYVGDGKFIHSSTSRGPVCQSLAQYTRWSSFDGGGHI